MKRIISTALIIPSLALAADGIVFENFNLYYATLLGRLFQGEAIKPYRDESYEGLGYAWEGSVDGHWHKVVIHQGDDDDVLFVDNHRIRPKQIRTFPGEKGWPTITLTGPGSCGTPEAYFAQGWACMQCPGQNVTGWHTFVYLIRLPKENTIKHHKLPAWALSGLYASCGQIRMQDNQIIFDKVKYRFQKGLDEPIGVSFNEYTIKEGKLKRTKKPPRNATYAEPEHRHKWYKFTLDKP